MIDFGFIGTALCTRLCLTLLHSLWQMAALFLLLRIYERLKQISVETQYSLHVAALCLGLFFLPMTFLLVESPNTGSFADEPLIATTMESPEPLLAIPEEVVSDPQAPPTNLVDEIVPVHHVLPEQSSSPAMTSTRTAPPQTSPATGSSWFELTPWLLAGYVAGLAVMLLRLLISSWNSNRLAATAPKISDRRLTAMLEALAERWSMKVTPVLAVAEQVIVPQIVGLWRPVILLPVSALSSMTSAELELILMHEVAHLRRHDMWVHLLQRLAESLLFFNPAIWLLNRRISLLREYCCDDLTLRSQTTSESEPQLNYAAALLKVVELCAASRVAHADLTALAVSGHAPSELRRRIARLFGEPLRDPVGISQSGLIAICGAVLMLLGSALWPANAADNVQAEAATAAAGLLLSTADSSESKEPSATSDKKSAKKNNILRGTITNEKGDPVPDVKVQLYSGFATRFHGQKTTTDAKGEYRFDPHTTIQRLGGSGNRRAFTGMTFTHVEYVPTDGLSFRDVPIESSEQVFDLVMVRGGKVKGVVTDHETGKPIGGLGLRMGDGYFKGQKDGRFMIYATTNDSGEFEFDPAPPQKYVIDINDSDYRGEYRYLKIGQVAVEAGKTAELQLKDAGLKSLEDPFKITGTAYGNDGKSMVYGGVGVKLLNGDGKLRSRGGGIDGGPRFGLSFGPIERREPQNGSPYGVGTHDIEIFGSNSRYGYRLVSRTPAEPLRITDDPDMPEVKDGIRYIRPNKPVDFKLVFAPDNTIARTFFLKVVGPDGKPVPHAKVQLRTNPGVTKDQIHRGKYAKDGRYGNHAVANKDGELSFTLSKRPSRFNLNIQHPGFAPYWAGWSPTRNGESIPDRFTAELDAGWIVGGIVVDQEGNPVEGVEVNPSVKYKMRPGDKGSMGVGTRIRTDAKGKWRFECVPATKPDVHVEVSHPDFKPHYQRLARDTFGLEGDAEPFAKIQLKPGLTVTGTVTDEAGQPIRGALIRTKFVNDIREAKTDSDGKYRLAGCDAKMTRIVVSAKGMATDLQTVRVDPDLGPVNFVMKPGGHVKIRVVDENGKGIPKARISYQQWRGGRAYWEFDHKRDYADENGVWEWDEAPLDEFTADICRPGGMQMSDQRLMAREEEYVFTPPKALVVSGSVTDATTGKPVPKFRVTPGLRNPNPRIGMDWDRRSEFEAKDGRYRVSQTEDAIAHVVRIEADGYKVAVSRDIKNDEGKVEINFKLQPAEDIAATVETEEGVPAVGAKIALGVAGSQITIRNGIIDDGSTYATRVDTDAKGFFSIPSREESFQLVITHADGFAYIKAPKEPIGKSITLTPWARVEGTFYIGQTPMPNIPLEANSNGLHSYGDDVPNIFTHDRTTTGRDGRFEFPRMFPGNGRIGREITLMVNDGASEVTSSVRMAAKFVSGKTTTLKIGGTGRSVIGKLVPPSDYTKKVLWNFALLRAELDLQMPEPEESPENVRDDPVARRGWWEAWQTTEQGKAWLLSYQEYERIRRESPSISATVDRDGSFLLDDVPPGRYRLSVRFSGDHQIRPGSIRNYRFTVPPDDSETAREPIRLKQITLE